MTREEIGAIRERAEDATVVIPIQTLTGYGSHNAVVNEYRTDEQFIIREDIPKLIAEIERLRNVISRIRCECGNELGSGWFDRGSNGIYCEYCASYDEEGDRC